MKNRTKKRTFIFEKIENLPSKIKAQRFRTPNMWRYEEIVRYTFFLHDFLEKNLEREIGRTDFPHMSEHVRTRNPNQCRIFHKKMLKIRSNLA